MASSPPIARENGLSTSTAFRIRLPAASSRRQHPALRLVVVARHVDVAGAERLRLTRRRIERVAPDAARVVRQQVDRDGRLGGGGAHPVDVVARRDQDVELAGSEEATLDELERVVSARVDLLVLLPAVEADEPQARWSWIGVSAPAARRGRRATATGPRRGRGATGDAASIPLAGAAAWYSGGSQSGSASSSANRGLSASQACSGEERRRSSPRRPRRTHARPACRGQTLHSSPRF